MVERSTRTVFSAGEPAALWAPQPRECGCGHRRDAGAGCGRRRASSGRLRAVRAAAAPHGSGRRGRRRALLRRLQGNERGRRRHGAAWSERAPGRVDRRGPRQARLLRTPGCRARGQGPGCGRDRRSRRAHRRGAVGHRLPVAARREHAGCRGRGFAPGASPAMPCCSAPRAPATTCSPATPSEAMPSSPRCGRCPRAERCPHESSEEPVEPAAPERGRRSGAGGSGDRADRIRRGDGVQRQRHRGDGRLPRPAVLPQAPGDLRRAGAARHLRRFAHRLPSPQAADVSHPGRRRRVDGAFGGRLRALAAVARRAGSGWAR